MVQLKPVPEHQVISYEDNVEELTVHRGQRVYKRRRKR
jgi:hypothetical protein